MKQLRLKGSGFVQTASFNPMQHKVLTKRSLMPENSQESSVPESKTSVTETLKRKRENHAVKPRHGKKNHRKRNVKLNNVSTNFTSD